jgi:hypothetical protein
MSLDALLLREIWTPSFMAGMFSRFGLQTMDHPQLHYLAGRDFFIGAGMSYANILNATSIHFLPEYLLAMKYPDWKTRALSGEEYGPLALSLRSILDNTMAPMTNPLAMKTFLGDPGKYRVPYQQYQQMGMDLLQFVVMPEQEKLDWGRIGLQNATFRKKAQALLDYVAKTRNWIVPYPVVGLEAILKKGMVESRDPFERTWCGLQLSLLLAREKADSGLIKKVVDGLMQQGGGRIPVADEDRHLLDEVYALMKSLP